MSSFVLDTEAIVLALMVLPAWWGAQRCKQTLFPLKAEVWTSSCESTEDGVMPSGQGEIGMARGSVMLPGVGDIAGGSTGTNFHELHR